MKNIKLFYDYFLIIVGSAALAASIVLLFSPGNIPAGGPAGIAIIGHHVIPVSQGAILLVINIPLLIAGYRFLGRTLFVRSVISVTLTSLMTDSFSLFLEVPDFGDNRLLNTLYGGLVAGVGIGLVFRGGGASGGWSILARLINKFTQLSLGQAMLLLDAIVVGLAAIVFRDLEASMLGGITIFVVGRVVDLIVSSATDIKIVHISCFNPVKLKELVETDLSISGSILNARNIKTHDDKQILFLIVEKSQIVRIRNIVEASDPSAYLIVMNGMEIYGGSHSV